MELRDYIRILHKSWILIVAMALLGMGLSAGYSLMTTPMYQSNTQLYVSVRSDNSATTGELVQGSTFARQVIGSYVDVVSTGLVLDPVVKQLGLDITSAQLSGHVSASSPANSVLLNISATSSSPEQAAQIANAVGESLKTIVRNELEPAGATGQSPVQLTTTQQALVPGAPISPNTKKNLALGLLLGLAIGFGIAVLRSVLDTRIHSLHDIEQITDKPLLGGITDDPDASQHPLVIHAERHSLRAESFRTLRTNLQFLNVGESKRSFVVTSAGPGEGKSTTAANLAIALADAGARVALVEADLRLPKVAEYMGIESAAGLTDVLIGKVELGDVLHRWGRGQLFVLPAGRIPPNPSELLGSAAMDSILKTLTERVDFVIIDAPPVLAVTDAVVIGKRSSGLLMVVASGRTTKQAFQGAIRTLETAGTTMLGVIVTMLPTKGPDSYGYGSYGYGAGTYYAPAEGSVMGQTALNGSSSQKTGWLRSRAAHHGDGR